MAERGTFTRRGLLYAGSLLTVTVPDLFGVDTAAAKGQQSRTLNSALWPEPPAIVIGISLTSPTLLPASKMQEGLGTFDFKLNLQPVLAESWDVSADGLTYRFKLRRNVKWHDGKPFTADDVVYTFNEYIPAVHQRSRNTFALVTTKAEDAHTVVLTLKRPYAPLLRSLDVIGAPIMPAHIYAGKDIRKNPANRNPIGTGPFKFSEWRSGEYIHLVRNADYWGAGLPHLDEIYYRFIPDSASRALALETGQLQLATQNDIELVDVRRLKALPNLQVSTKGWEWASTVCWLELNLRRKPFNDVRFRKAVMHALNRDFIRDSIFLGMAKVATGPIHSDSPFHAPDLPRYDYDPARARQLLDEMGLRPDSRGKRVEIGLLGLPYGEMWDRLSQFIKQSLSQVGVRVNIETTDVAGWGNRISNWETDMSTTYLSTLSDPAIGVARTFITSNQLKGVLFSNTSGYSNPEVDRLFDAAAKEQDETKRVEMYRRIQHILVDDVALCWLVEPQSPTVYAANLKNVIRNGLGPNDSFAEAYFG